MIESIGGLSLAGFSKLAPGTHIQPHIGWAKSVYRLHLGLTVPENCALRVGNDTREWQEGKCLIFDDTIEHEAWNKSKHTRGTLLLDFLRPGVTKIDDDDVPKEVLRYTEQLNQQ